MVAKIRSGKSLPGALNYNEHKVREGRAELIAVSGYLLDAKRLTFDEKLFRLTDLAARNTRTKTNTVHISLNFAEGERLANETLESIAGDYMKGIGFQDQPYLVYRHDDAGHPHVHIVSTNIRADGDRINLHYLGKSRSEPVRKVIEQQYGLVRAEGRMAPKPQTWSEPDKVVYGKSETKRAITNVLSFVLTNWKFTTIGELNAVLRAYHVEADRGSRGSRMYARRGLFFWLLANNGMRTGVPVKASAIYGKPVLGRLEERFRLNEVLRQPFRAGLIREISALLEKPSLTETVFKQKLESKGIGALLSRNPDGRLYGVTFTDIRNRAVFNGSALGKAYSANQTAAWLLPEQPSRMVLAGSEQQTQTSHTGDIPAGSTGGDELIDILFEPQRDDIAALNKFKKKKKRGLKM